MEGSGKPMTSAAMPDFQRKADGKRNPRPQIGRDLRQA